jgi:hypothetical protein
MNGTYTGTHWDTVGSGASNPGGVTNNNNYMWILDWGDTEVYVYFMNGTYTGNHWDTAISGGEYPVSITQNGTYFWIVDLTGLTERVYIYDFDGVYPTYPYLDIGTPDVTHEWVGGDFCYQETANVSTYCGGLATGAYAIANSTYYGYLYVNYTKPTNATNGSFWVIKNGYLNESYNNLPSTCWNYNSTTILLRAVSFFDNDGGASYKTESYGQCYNGSWITFTPNSTIMNNDGGFGDSPCEYDMYDGDWDTDCFWLGNNAWYDDGSGDLAHSRIFEEAMIWNAGGTFNTTATVGELFPAAINSALNNGACDCTNCSLSGLECKVPFLFHSDTSGILQYSNMNITYNLTLAVNLTSPANNTISTNRYNNFSCNVLASEGNVSNVTLKVYNQTGSLNYSNTTTNFNSMDYCYQETANVSTTCGGLNTGSYLCTGYWNALGFECDKAFDGNWSIDGRSLASNISTLYINYTKPSGSSSSSLWQVKDTLATANLTIDSACWSQSKLQFQVISKETTPIQTNWSCWNGTSWKQLRGISGGSDNTYRFIYEEAMFWKDINTSASPLTASWNNISLNDGNYSWNCLTYNLLGENASADNNYTLSLDATTPQIAFSSPTESSGTYKSQNWIAANVSINESHLANFTYTLSNHSFSYQENANSTICNGLFDFSIHNCSYGYDGNWSTYARSTASAPNYSYIYFNYSKPSNVLNTSLWQVKDDDDIANLTLTSSCWSQNSSIIQLRVYAREIFSAVWWQCYTGSSWTTLRIGSGYPVSMGEMYEEAMFWDISNGVNSTTYTSYPTMINWTGLADNIYYYSVSAYDIFGNTNSTETRNITLDTTSPIITLNAPANNANSSNALVTFNCTASDNIQLKNVSLFSNFTGSWIENETNSSPINNSATIFTKYPADGRYIWNCQACDIAGGCVFGASNYTLNQNQSDIQGPATLSDAGRTYYLTKNLIGLTSTAIIVAANDIVFDCQNNHINGTGVANGIYIYNVSNATIKNCKINSWSNGIYILNSSDSNITGNTLRNATNGIMLNGSSSSNLIESNSISNSSTYGINNIATGSVTAYNNLFNNTNNEHNVTILNTTNSTGPNIIGGPYIGGNFYAAPNGSGFSQVQSLCNPGYDGFCKNHYVGSDDELPLTNLSQLDITIQQPANNSIFNYSTGLNLNYTRTTNNSDKCWYNIDGGANTTLATCQNTTFSTTAAEHVLTLYGNDTMGDWNYNTTQFSVTNVSNETYNPSVNEMSSQTFNITIDRGSNTDIIPIFVWNGTEYNESILYNPTATNITFSKTLAMPEISLQTNYSFYWKFNMTYNGNSQNFNSTPHNQTVNVIILALCNGTYTTQSMVFQYKDEKSFSLIDTTNVSATIVYWVNSQTINRSLSFTQTNTNNTKICIYPSDGTLYGNIILEYEAANYTAREYYAQNTLFTNSTNNVTTLLLSTADAVKFFLSVSQAGVPISGAVVNVNKFNIGTGTYIFVDSRITDENGVFIEWLDLDTQYMYVVSKDGVVLGSQVLTSRCTATPCLLEIDIGAVTVDDWKPFDDVYAKNVMYTLNYNKTSDIVTYTFVDTLGTSQHATLIVERTMYNQSDLIICNTSVDGVSGGMTCNVSNYEGEFRATAYCGRSPDKIVDFITFVKNLFSGTMETEGLLVQMLIVITIAFVGIWNPAVGIVMTVAAIILSNFLGFTVMTPTVLILIVVLAVIIIIKIRT